MSDESNVPTGGGSGGDGGGGGGEGARRRRRPRRRGPRAGGDRPAEGGAGVQPPPTGAAAPAPTGGGSGGEARTGEPGQGARRRRRRRRPGGEGGRPGGEGGRPGGEGGRRESEGGRRESESGRREPADSAAPQESGPRERPAGPGGEPSRRRTRRRRRPEGQRAEGPRADEPRGERPERPGRPERPERPERSRRPRPPAGADHPAQAARSEGAAAEAQREAGLAGALEFPDESDWDISAPGARLTPPPAAAAAAGSDEDEAWSGAAPAGPPLLDFPEPELDPDGDDEFIDLDPAAPEPKGILCNLAQVYLRDRCRLCPVEAGDLNPQPGDRVVVETDQGLSVGQVMRAAERALSEEPPRRVLRRVDANDQRQQARNLVREREAFTFCRDRIKQRKLPMKLIRVEYLHGGSKAMFYFAAENRVDFRDLVKDLAARLHTRIVMRQVGVRDESRMTGGIGSCGRELCCATWLPHFEPVSIRMAKDQNLVLNPQKVSGQCGRLKCCLAYEQAQYHECRKKLPKVGRRVLTPEGEGKVLDIDILRLLVRVIRDDGTEQVYAADRLQPAAPSQGPRDGG
jgi:cell fate regulator YaaT (PSP1 superfamily)